MLENFSFIKPLAIAAIAGLGAFFNVPAFYGLLVILLLDWVTGVQRARVQNKLCSAKLGLSFEKAFHYTALFAALHLISTVVLKEFLMVEQFILIGLALKETLSVVENIKAVQIVRGIDNPIIDKLIELLGLDIKKIIDQLDIKEEETNNG